MVLLITLLQLSQSLCSFEQFCDGLQNCHTPEAISPPQPAKFNSKDFTDKLACPYYKDQTVCCSNDQNSLMQEKFSALDNTFGTNGGGCDVCAANMKYLWCIFTCDQNQASWVVPGETVKVPDPSQPSVIVEVLKLNYTVSDNLACSLYQSCKKCSYVTEVSAMQSSQGFLQFQGYNAIPYGNTWVTFLFSNLTTALDINFANCNTNSTSLYGYDLIPCSCNSCETLCLGSGSPAVPTTLAGMDWIIIGIIYLSLALVSLVILFGYQMWNLNKRRQENEEELMETYQNYQNGGLTYD